MKEEVTKVSDIKFSYIEIIYNNQFRSIAVDKVITLNPKKDQGDQGAIGYFYKDEKAHIFMGKGMKSIDRAYKKHCVHQQTVWSYTRF